MLKKSSVIFKNYCKIHQTRYLRFIIIENIVFYLFLIYSTKGLLLMHNFLEPSLYQSVSVIHVTDSIFLKTVINLVGIDFEEVFWC